MRNPMMRLPDLSKVARTKLVYHRFLFKAMGSPRDVKFGR